MQNDVFLYLKRELWDKKILPRPSLRPKSDWTGANTIVLQSSLIRLIFDKAIPWNSVRNDLGLVKRD